MHLLSPTFDFWFLGTAFFLFGLLFGSFLNVCIYRLPRELNIVSPRSACPSCGAPIAAYDNIPVLSWILLSGKCRACRTAIPSRYWLVELMTGCLFIAAFWKFGFTFAALRACVFCFLVLGLIFTDADLKILPDALTLPGIVIGMALSLLEPVDGFGQLLLTLPALPPDLAWRLVSLGDACIGAMVAGGFIWAIGALWKRMRGIEAMGFGDVKLMAMVGSFLGVRYAMLTILLGSFTGSLAGLALVLAVRAARRRRWQNSGLAPAAVGARARASVGVLLSRFPLPFGIFLGAGALLSLFFGGPLLHWYLRLFR